MGFLDLKIARKAGAEVCCARSSNSSDGGGFKETIAHAIGRFLYSKYVDVAISPSDLAAVYTFGKRSYHRGNVHILHNAVDLDVFRYDIGSRKDIKSEFGISGNTKVYGHIGRFMQQKNHMFLADIFKNIKDIEPNSLLLLVGDGPLKEKFINKAHDLGIHDSIIFAGIRSDIPRLLSAMDAFIFPSFYEGMPNTVIEAQATGLPCVISENITKEANITGLVDYLSLTESAETWAKLSVSRANKSRMDTADLFRVKNYDIKETAKEFERIVFI